MLTTYKLDREYLSLLEEPQLKLFENEFKTKKDEFLGIKFEKRGYTVNDKIEQIINSKIQTIGFFSRRRRIRYWLSIGWQ